MCQPCEDLPPDNHFYTHFPKHPTCEICNHCKIQREGCRRDKGLAKFDNLQKPLAFADALTADHMIVNDGDRSRHNDHIACVIQGQHMKYLMSFAPPTKSAADTNKAFQRFLGPQVKPKHVYTDGSNEFEKALKDFDILCDTATPYRAETNGIAERAVRRVKERTSCTLVQSGLSGEWWREASNTYCFLRNVTEAVACGKTAYERF